MGLFLNLPSGAVVDVVYDKPTGLGFRGGRPKRNVYVLAVKEAEHLLGFSIVTWGSFVNPATGFFWCEIGPASTCKEGSPPTLSVLPP